MLATYIANLKPSELEQQSLLMLDFDNQDKDNQFTLEQALADRFIRVTLALSIAHSAILKQLINLGSLCVRLCFRKHRRSDNGL